MNSCGRGCTLFRREEVRPQKRLFCDGKLVDYKRREVGRLRGKYSRRRGGGRQSRTALCFACRRHAKRAASPHPAALAYSLRRLTPPTPSRGRLYCLFLRSMIIGSLVRELSRSDWGSAHRQLTARAPSFQSSTMYPGIGVAMRPN